MQEKIDSVFLKQLKIDLGLRSYEELARRIGCTMAAMKKWLYENQNPGPHFTRVILGLHRKVRKEVKK